MGAADRILVWLLWTGLLVPVQRAALWLDLEAARRVPRLYHRGVCQIFRVEVRPRGGCSRRHPTLFIANHTSCFDIPVLGSVLTASFIATAEICDWPLVGLLARLQRTVFIPRERMNAGRSKSAIQPRLDAGDNLVIFPEGTTGDGSRLLPFRSALFALAEERPVEGPLTVQPVTIAYVTCNGMPIRDAARSRARLDRRRVDGASRLAFHPGRAGPCGGAVPPAGRSAAVQQSQDPRKPL